MKAYFDPPKTLSELRKAAMTPRIGYDNHHVVERATRSAGGSEDNFIYGSDNVVGIPTFKHWDLNSWYETEDKDYGKLTPREYLKDKSLAERYRIGLRALREIGVLKR